MKIAIPVEDNEVAVCQVLARAPFFLVREDEKDTIIVNPAAQSQSGAGLQVAQFLVDEKIDVLITPRCGQNAAEVFEAANMKLYKSISQPARENLDAYREGTLEVLTKFHGGFHGIQ